MGQSLRVCGATRETKLKLPRKMTCVEFEFEFDAENATAHFC